MQDEGSVISGLGLMTCAEFLASKEAKHWTYEANLQWILGYATAMNQTAPLRSEEGNFGEGLEWEPIAEWLESYSMEHPSDLMVDAAAKLYATFAGGKRVLH